MQIKIQLTGRTEKVTLSNNATAEDALKMAGIDRTGYSVLLNDQKIDDVSTSLEDQDVISLTKKDSNG